MANFSIQNSNTAALITLPDGTILYANGSGTVVGAPDGSTFVEYATPDLAYAAAVAVDSNFNGNKVYGEIILTADNVSNSEVEPVIGNAATLNSLYTSNQTGTTFTYVWYKDGQLINGATTDSITTGSFTEDMYGTYTCEVSAVNSSKNTTGSITTTILVKEGGLGATKAIGGVG